MSGITLKANYNDQECDIHADDYDSISDIKDTIAAKLFIDEDFDLFDGEGQKLNLDFSISDYMLEDGSIIFVKTRGDNTIKVQFQQNDYQFHITENSTIDDIINLLSEELSTSKDQIIILNRNSELQPNENIKTIECPDGLTAKLRENTIPDKTESEGSQKEINTQSQQETNTQSQQETNTQSQQETNTQSQQGSHGQHRSCVKPPPVINQPQNTEVNVKFQFNATSKTFICNLSHPVKEISSKIEENIPRGRKSKPYEVIISGKNFNIKELKESMSLEEFINKNGITLNEDKGQKSMIICPV